MAEEQDKKENKPKEIRRGIRAILRHLSVYRNTFIVISILGFISAAANGSIPYVTGRFMDALIVLSQHKVQMSWGGVPLWGALLAIWAVIQFVANNIDWIDERLRRKIDTDVHMRIQTEGFVHLYHLPVAYHKNTQIPGIMAKFSSAGWRTSTIIGTIVNVAPQLLSVVLGITLAATINILLASVLVAGVILYTLLLFFVLRPIAELESKGHKAWNDNWNDAAAAVLQIETVKQAAAEEYASETIRRELLGNTQRLWYRVEKIWSNVSYFQRLIVFLTQLTVFILSVRFVTQGIITVGDLIALNGYALMFFGPFVSLGYSWQNIQNGIIAAAQAEEVFDEPREVYNPKDAIPVDKISGKINFDKVSFRYGPDQPQVLDTIEMHVNPGDVVALVGESGGGKSTIISLISGYYFPTEGEVLVDGINTRKFRLHDLRSHIAVVPQEVALFNDTITANIKYGISNKSDDEVVQVAKQAHIDEFIQTLPDKYSTLVGERGIKLSVGQKQRVALARAMLRNPSILILDEPTSALDSNTERFITKSLEDLMKGRTTFIIAHRLSTVRKANKIFVLHQGKIVESGTHDELMQIEGGRYRHMYEYHVGLH